MSAPLITAKEVGTLLGLSARAVYDIPDDQLPRYRLGAGRGAVRFDPADVEAYKATCRSRPALQRRQQSMPVRLRASDPDADLMAMFAAVGVLPVLAPPGGRWERTQSKGLTPAKKKARKSRPYVAKGG